MRFSVVVLLVLFASGCAVPCGSDDPAIDALRKLPPDYYAALFQEAEAVECRSKCRLAGFDRIQALANRKIVLKKYSNGEGFATLKFCFDEGIALKFRGFGSGSGEIWVTWGGAPPSFGEERLWIQSGTAVLTTSHD